MAKIIALSEAVSIAIHGMVLIAKSTEEINVTQIAERTTTSRHHVAKIMQRLVKDNFLTSQRGPRGGFKLKKDPEDITFLDLFETIDGKIEISDCPSHKEECPFGDCVFGNIAIKISMEFRDYLSKQTLEKYIN